jgi:predicted ribosomally synthesized peptide with nif11-like leader
MSVSSAKAFIEKVQSDSAFRRKLEDAPSDDERKKIIKAAGFDFTKDEIKSAASEHGALSDEELDKVAGGSWAETLTAAGISVAIAAACA